MSALEIRSRVAVKKYSISDTNSKVDLDEAQYDLMDSPRSTVSNNSESILKGKTAANRTLSVKSPSVTLLTLA